MHWKLIPFTLQTLLVVLGLKGQCPGCLREEASYPSCIQNNLEENFHLWFAPHDQCPFCHLQERYKCANYEDSSWQVHWLKPSNIKQLPSLISVTTTNTVTDWLKRIRGLIVILSLYLKSNQSRCFKGENSKKQNRQTHFYGIKYVILSK